MLPETGKVTGSASKAVQRKLISSEFVKYEKETALKAKRPQKSCLTFWDRFAFEAALLFTHNIIREFSL